MSPFRAPWEDKFCVQQSTKDPATEVWAVDSETFLVTDIGLDLAKLALPLTAHPHLNPGVEQIDQRKTMGESTRRVGATANEDAFEYQVSAQKPSWTFELDLTAEALGLFGWLLLQNGVSEGLTPTFLMTMIPYTSAQCEIWASVLRVMSAGTADSHVVHGCIVQSITISGEEGQPVKLSVEMLGAKFYDTFDYDLVASTSAFSVKAPLMFHDGVFKMDGTTINIPSFSITISNNAIAKQYNANQIKSFILGDLTGEGEIVIPWGQATEGGNAQIDNFLAGVDIVLTAEWGDTSVPDDQSVKLTMNSRYMGSEVTTEDEVATSGPFHLVNDGTTSLEILAADSVDRGVT